jgi:hypothetical protein
VLQASPEELIAHEARLPKIASKATGGALWSALASADALAEELT